MGFRRIPRVVLFPSPCGRGVNEEGSFAFPRPAGEGWGEGVNVELAGIDVTGGMYSVGEGAKRPQMDLQLFELKMTARLLAYWIFELD